MNKYFIQLFLRENTVILPGFGALTVPNGRKSEILFIPYLTFDDGKLVNYIVETEGVDAQNAQNTIAKFIREMESILNKGESFDIFEFGRFRKDKKGEIQFESWMKDSEPDLPPAQKLSTTESESEKIDSSSIEDNHKSPEKSGKSEPAIQKEDTKNESVTEKEIEKNLVSDSESVLTMDNERKINTPQFQETKNDESIINTTEIIEEIIIDSSEIERETEVLDAPIRSIVEKRDKTYIPEDSNSLLSFEPISLLDKLSDLETKSSMQLIEALMNSKFDETETIVAKIVDKSNDEQIGVLENKIEAIEQKNALARDLDVQEAVPFEIDLSDKKIESVIEDKLGTKETQVSAKIKNDPVETSEPIIVFDNKKKNVVPELKSTSSETKETIASNEIKVELKIESKTEPTTQPILLDDEPEINPKELDPVEVVPKRKLKKKRKGFLFWFFITLFSVLAIGSILVYFNYDKIRPHLPFLPENQNKFNYVQQKQDSLELLNLGETENEGETKVKAPQKEENTEQSNASATNSKEKIKENSKEIVKEISTKSAKGTKGMFYLVSGSYTSQEQIDKRVKYLTENGFLPEVIDGLSGKKYVTLGAFEKSSDALETSKKLKEKGQKSWLWKK